MLDSQFSGFFRIPIKYCIYDIFEVLSIFLHRLNIHDQESFIVAINIVMDGLVHKDRNGISGDCGQTEVHVLVNFKEGLGLVSSLLSSGFGLSYKTLQLAGLGRGDPLCGMGCRFTFHSSPEFGQMGQGDFLVTDEQGQTFPDRSKRGVLDYSSTSYTKLYVNKSLLFQNPKGFPQGSPTDLEHIFEFPFRRQDISRLELPAEDSLLNLFHHVLKYFVLLGSSEHMHPQGYKGILRNTFMRTKESLTLDCATWQGRIYPSPA